MITSTVMEWLQNMPSRITGQGFGDPKDLTQPWGVVIVGAVTVFGSIYALYRNAASERKIHERETISKAMAALVAWKELPYRIARRFDDTELSKKTLVEEFHRVQEDLAYYSSWMMVFDDQLGTAYRTLVDSVKRATAEKIKSAWADGPQDVGFLGGKYSVMTDAEEHAFLARVRKRMRRLP